VTRQRYETDGDRKAQQEIAQFFSEKTGRALAATPKRYYFCDYFARSVAPRGKVGEVSGAIIEVKDRPRAKWGEPLSISAEKVARLVMFCSAFDAYRAVIVIRFGCGTVAWTFASEVGQDVYVGGRRDRDDPDDEELMVRIPHGAFRAIGRMT
jgi:uncharacterized protein (DUF3820 family)